MLDPFDQLAPPPPAKPKIPLTKVVLYNFGIMLAYLLLLNLFAGSDGPEGNLGVMIGMSFLLLVQVGINLLAGLILLFRRDKRPLGSALLLGGLLTAVIGFGTCVLSAGGF